LDLKTNFNIRVYGLLINERDEVLVSDEYRNGFAFTKFPGGGMEFGEGFKETLKREFQEELLFDVEVEELFYFNEFFQVSKFNPKDQLFSFYYTVHYPNWKSIVTDQHEVPLTTEGEKHRWISVKNLEKAMFTFPIDQLVAERLVNRTYQKHAD
jgi:8-oxo-dGTP diphosphatase